MNTTDAPSAAVRGSGFSAGLGPALEDAAYDCLSALAGVETYDVNLRDHAEAWAAIEAFAAKVRAAERERWRPLVVEMHELADNWPGVAYTEDLDRRVRAALKA